MRVRYYGHFWLDTGYGRAALEYALALANIPEVELDLRPIPAQPRGQLSHRQSQLLRHCPVANPVDLSADIAPDVVLVHTLPGDCCRVLELEQIDPTKVPCVAYTTWETDSMPAWISETLYGSFRRVLMPAMPEWRAITNDHLGRTRVVPHCFDPEHVKTMLGYGDKNQAEPNRPFQFYFVGSWSKRKNVDGLIRAFAHAVERYGMDARLHLHCPGATSQDFEVAIYETQTSIRPLVTFTNEPVSEEFLWGSVVDADCFVTASRGEAWNLPAFEAFLAGRFVIAPAGHGSDAYLQYTNAALYEAQPSLASVGVRLERLPNGTRVSVRGGQGVTSKQCWWEPDLLELASKMNRTAAAGQRQLRTRGDLADLGSAYNLFTHDAVGPQLLDALKEDL